MIFFPIVSLSPEEISHEALDLLDNGRGRTGSTGPVLPEPVLVIGFSYRNRVLPEPVLPEISNGFVQSLSYRIGTGLDRTGTGSYRIIVYR
uniref:Uncharacterized protein n=1 Tax=Solanum tuberosum TaxID=4113 RepID=M1DTR9_SOLTU